LRKASKLGSLTGCGALIVTGWYGFGCGAGGCCGGVCARGWTVGGCCPGRGDCCCATVGIAAAASITTANETAGRRTGFSLDSTSMIPD
jgi:hypothetical protein